MGEDSPLYDDVIALLSALASLEKPTALSQIPGLSALIHSAPNLG